jgi:hypothetical protein
LTPERLHLVLNHLPFLGPGFALIPLLAGLIAKSRPALIAGLVIASLSGWSAGLVMGTGEEAYERYLEHPERHFLDPGADKALVDHEERAHGWSKVMYGSALICTLALGAVIWRPKHAAWSSAVAAAACLASLGSGIWISESGGKIRRPDFRVQAPREE